MKGKRVIGRSDIVNFPELELHQLAVKIDSGAYSSSIHCHRIRTEIVNDVEVLKFNLLDPNHPNYHEKEFEFTEFDHTEVKNSFGEKEVRYVITTSIDLFDQSYPISLSLTNRGNMRFPVLLGRKIVNHFLIDVTKKNLSFKYLNKITNQNENSSLI